MYLQFDEIDYIWLVPLVCSLTLIRLGGILGRFFCVNRCGCVDGPIQLLHYIFLLWYMDQSLDCFFLVVLLKLCLTHWTSTSPVYILSINILGKIFRAILKLHMSLLTRQLLKYEDFLMLYYLLHTFLHISRIPFSGQS